MYMPFIASLLGFFFAVCAAALLLYINNGFLFISKAWPGHLLYLESVEAAAKSHRATAVWGCEGTQQVGEGYLR